MNYTFDAKIWNMGAGRFQLSSRGVKLFSVEQIEDSIQQFYEDTGGLFSNNNTFLLLSPKTERAAAYIVPSIPRRRVGLAEVLLFPFGSKCPALDLTPIKELWPFIEQCLGPEAEDDPGPEAA